MSEDEQRLEILKACGWTCTSRQRHQMPYWKNPKGEPEAPPDPVHDLNAMHDAEQFLRDGCMYWPFYIDELLNLCTNAYPHLPGEKLEPNWSATVGSTAKQRAEAFLRTIGKWQ